MRVSESERLRRWRLVLGGGAADGTNIDLRGDDQRIDVALGALYDRQVPRGRGTGRAGGLARSAPSVARWLGDIRRFFPTPVVQVLQRDAVERLDLRQLLLEPELLDELEPDLHLVTLLVELNRALPDETRATARQVIARVLGQLEARLADRTRQAVRGALARASRTGRPRPADIDWPPRPPPPARAGRAAPGQPPRPPAPGRHRLAPHDPRQPPPLAARAAHRRARAPRRLRPPPAQPRPRRRHRRRPERLDGRQRR